MTTLATVFDIIVVAVIYLAFIAMIATFLGGEKDTIDYEIPESWKRPMPGAEDIERSYDPDMIMRYTLPDKYKKEE